MGVTDMTEMTGATPKVNQGQVPPTTVKTWHLEDNSITSAKIKSLSFDKAQGGTLTLGGQNNENGEFSLENAAGTEVIHMDNTGMNVYNGNITVKNAAGNTVFDTSGLVSSTNFLIGNLFNGNATDSTSSTSFIDISGSTMNSFTLARTTRVLCLFTAYGYNDQAINSNLTDRVEVSVYDGFDGSSLGNLLFYGSTSTNVTVGGGGSLSFNLTVGDQLTSEAAILSLAAGTHTLKLQFRAQNGGTAYIHAWNLGYAVLGS